MAERAEKHDVAKTPAAVHALVRRFAEHAESYGGGGGGSYNETQIRREFIDPLFKALGWDIDNSQGFAEAYKDVIHEDAIRIGGATKAPDYCFRIGGVRKFFVEAKKPAIDIKADASPAYQLRRYAWSGKLPLSILTDFEEIAVYDCRIKPAETDKASTARTLYLRYDELPDRWHELASIFSRDAVLKGSFDAYADSAKRKRGTAEVDDAFLAEIEDWRDVLARNIALRNEDLSQRDLNFAVQRTIDRIVFLRICEDRGIERYGTLQGLTNGDKVYERLFERFRHADDRYNSGLFHFTREKGRADAPDDLTPSLQIDDKPLKDILRRLYYPECPYEFSVLPADILGHVYEQFLGKVIRLTPGHRAVVEEKPEVRKAGGVYYTPTYIVNYIVKQTVGALVDGKTPQEIGALTAAHQPSKSKDARPRSVIDPACGSGSFLLGAYQFLLDWYRDCYVEDGPAKHTTGKSPRLYQHGSGDYRLTTAERKRILLSHIHGVDIDPQAVEVTKLSLLLKVLEGESAENVDAGLRLFRERALPDLANNIKCGNSLIAPDFYDDVQMGLFDEEQRLKINVFDWKDEFADIMRAGGFDAVIGNPPYVLLQTLELPDVFSYLAGRFVSARYKIDTYHLFFEQSLAIARGSGLTGMITPNTFLRNKHAVELRRLLLSDSAIQSLELHDFPVFRNASVDTCVTVLERSQARQHHRVKVSRLTSPLARTPIGFVPQADWLLREDLNFDLTGDADARELVRKVHSRSIPLGSFATAYFGIQTHDRKSCVSPVRRSKSWKPAVDGANISRYCVAPPSEWVNSDRGAIKSGGDSSAYERVRIGTRQIGRRPVATLLPAGWYSLNTIYNIFFTREVNYDLCYILGLMSSRLLGWYWELHFFDHKRTFPKIKKGPLLSLPIREINFKSTFDRQKHDAIVSLVRTMLELHSDHADAKTSHAKTARERQIAATDRKIDELVYDLYGLSADEIRVVEEATQ